VLHWHAVDAQSFPIESETYPLLAEAGCWGPGAVYSHADLQQVVQYALYRGVRVVVEFDMPGHAASWGRAYPNITVYCQDYESNVNNIPLDPTQPFTYQLVQNFLLEMATLFPDAYVHLGGDEVVMGCWEENPAVSKWMQQHGMDSTALEGYFEANMYKFLTQQANRSMVVWQEIFNDGVVPGKDVVVQVWKDADTANQVVTQGYHALVSFAWYLDKQIPDPPSTHYEWVDTWQDFYQFEPYTGIDPSATSLILGGEACMWAEQVDSMNADSRIWPRACGVTERLWSPILVNSVADAIPRLVAFRCRLAQRNIGAGPVAPDFCPLPSNNFAMKPHQ